MGRCEPYCLCEFYFLPGDYHLGRSCRFRRFARGGDDVAERSGRDELSLQEAWQEVWQSNMKHGAEDDITGIQAPFSSTESNPDVGADATSWERASTVCALPPESRYVMIVRQIQSHLPNITSALLDLLSRCQKLKSATSNAVKTIMFKTCEKLKKSVKERAQIRDQLVVLTRKGAVLMRWVCGASSKDGTNREVDENQPNTSQDSDDKHAEDDATDELS